MMEPLRRGRNAGEAGTPCIMWSVVPCFAMLAGLLSLVASRFLSFHSDCDSASTIVLQTSLDAEAKLPGQIFSPSSNRILRGKQGREPNLLEHKGVVGTVTRSALPSLASLAGVSVPQTIWQTARSRQDTPAYGIDLFNTWTKSNPGWDHYFMDDEDVEAFVGAHYNDTVLQAFKDLPLGVMKADVFRYMIVHQYGGVYADMDTECFQPVQTWAPHGCQFAVATESDVHFSQWAFAAVAGHGALGRVLELVLQRMISRVYKQYLQRADEEFVHEVTGPSVFTEGILDFLGVEHVGHADVKLYPLLYRRRKEFRARGVCLLTWHELQRMLKNKYSSLNSELQTGSWTSWTKAREELMQRLAEQKAADGGEQRGEEEQDGEEQEGEETVENQGRDQRQSDEQPDEQQQDMQDREEQREDDMQGEEQKGGDGDEQQQGDEDEGEEQQRQLQAWNRNEEGEQQGEAQQGQEG